MKDWIGNNKSAFTCNGASNHSKGQRQLEDYYATEPKAIDLLFDVESFKDCIWECCCGEGHLSKRMIELGADVISSDLFDRGYGITGFDFLKADNMLAGTKHIITNPPYKYATEFVYKANELLPKGGKCAMFLKLTFLESKKRKKLFEQYPPKVIYVSSSRLQCAKNGDFKIYKSGVGTAIAYAWYIWEKGYTGETIIKWIN